MEPEWGHLRNVVAILVSAGNNVVGGGFRPSQGGFSCEVELPLDAAVVKPLVESDDRLSFDPKADELTCRHCWTTIFGGNAADRYRVAYQTARRQPES